MPLESKVKQLQGVPDGARSAEFFMDVSRSQDADAGNGKTLRGFKYRGAGRGVSLPDGQIDRPSQGKDYSTAFPAQSARAASWDVELERRVGEALGEETMTSKNTVLTAPCMNVLRHPYWGRSQETYGEDSFHSGRMASALTAGIQEHVIACAKHFAANNIERGRNNQDALLDEQSLREVYGRHFEMVVREGGVGCIMAAYNMVNGTPSSVNRHLLTDILRDDFGFRGFVITDFFGMPGGIAGPSKMLAEAYALDGMRAGLDIELPVAMNYAMLPTLLEDGRLTEAELDTHVGRVLEQKLRFGIEYTDGPFGRGAATTELEGDSIVGNESHLALAEEAALKSAVLLTNGFDGTPVLPIRDVTSIAVVGVEANVRVSDATTLPVTGDIHRFALDVNLGDRGTSRVNADPALSVGPFAGIQAVASARGVSVTTGTSVQAAADASFVVAVVGLTASDESEEHATLYQGDRTTLVLPYNQAAFVATVLDLGKPTVIVVESGSIVNLPWLSHVNRKQATIWTGYSGQRGGLALAKLLFGEANFSGKMPLAWPKESDLPAFRSEGLTTPMGYFFGYRYYDLRKATGTPVELVFPFGHGLSYTTFEYRDLQVPCEEVSSDAIVDVSVEVTNRGAVAGEEIAMLFVAGPLKAEGVNGERPVKELKSFAKVRLAPGASERVRLPLGIRDLRHWEGEANGSWIIDEGVYTLMAGPNGDDEALETKATLTVHR